MAIQGLFIEARLLDSGLKLTFDNEMKLTSKLEGNLVAVLTLG